MYYKLKVKISIITLGVLSLFPGCSESQNSTVEEPTVKEENLPSVSDESLFVMSYNIRGDKVEDGENQWKYRKGRVVSLIGKYRPPILGLQEAKPEQLGSYSMIMRVMKNGA